MKTVFFGKFDHTDRYTNVGVSIAGSEVQKKLCRTIKTQLPMESDFLAAQTGRAWPYGPFIIKSCSEENVTFLPTLNLLFLREIQFFFQISYYLWKAKPKIIIQYNPFPLGNLSVLCYRFFSDCKCNLIIQDLAVGKAFSISRKLADRFSGMFCRFYDRVYPVSEAISVKLKIPTERVTIFPGGMESEEPVPRKDWPGKQAAVKNIVFAGRLSRHNGIDQILKNLDKIPEEFCLHIFGDGPLSAKVKEAEKNSTKIKYYGRRSKAEVDSFQSAADANFCLRYSHGLDEKFFFPSKFFSTNCYSGFVLCNDFKNMPLEYAKIGLLLDSELENLNDILLRIDDAEFVTNNRQKVLFKRYRWSKIAQQMLSG